MRCGCCDGVLTGARSPKSRQSLAVMCSPWKGLPPCILFREKKESPCSVIRCFLLMSCNNAPHRSFVVRIRFEFCVRLQHCFFQGYAKVNARFERGENCLERKGLQIKIMRIVMKSFLMKTLVKAFLITSRAHLTAASCD